MFNNNLIINSLKAIIITHSHSDEVEFLKDTKQSIRCVKRRLSTAKRGMVKDKVMMSLDHFITLTFRQSDLKVNRKNFY